MFAYKFKWLAISLISILSIGCSEDPDCVAKENTDCVCPQNYDPVCGCDGVTYSNGCSAACVGISAVKGPCNVDKNLILGNYEFLGNQKQDNINLSNPVKKHKYDINCEFGDSEAEYKLDGRASVNYYSGVYEVVSSFNNKGKINMSSFGTTKIGGATEDIIYETNYWKNLSAVSNYELKGNLLILTYEDEGSQDQLVFKKK